MGYAEKDLEEDVVTRRTKEKAQEDREFISVIVKRNDEARRHPDDILEHAIEEGKNQIERSFPSLFLSAVAAGLILGFTVMAVAVMHELTAAVENPWVARLAKAAVYPLGFVVCVMSGTELFTEHTATAVYPVLDRKSRFTMMLRLWGVVLLGNLVGAFMSAGLLAMADPVVKAAEGYVELGKHMTTFSLGPLLVSGILAGWLMALGGWLILATNPNVAQIVSIYIVTFLIGIGGLHHSIAGAVEVFTAVLLSDALTLPGLLSSLSTVVVGNLIGGSVFVAVLNYGHIRKSQEIEEQALSENQNTKDV